MIKKYPPRFMVKALYPGSPYTMRVNEIVEYRENDFQSEGEWVKSYKEYPHLFEELEWWQNRAFEDMPIYVVKTANYGYHVAGDVMKVSHWSNDPQAASSTWKSSWWAHIGGNQHVYNASLLVPATEDQIKNAKQIFT